MATTNNSDSTLEIVLLVLAGIVLAPVLLMTLAIPLFGMGGGMMGGVGGSGASPIWGYGMSIVWLLVFIGIGYVVYRGAVGRETASTDSAMAELRLAYARGDITQEEFEVRRATLKQQPSRD